MKNQKINREAPFATIRETVTKTGLSERYIRKLKSDGKLPCVMSGNRSLVTVPQLIELMNKISMENVKKDT